MAESGSQKKAVTRNILRRLARYESRNIAHSDPDGSWPIVWERAKGCDVWDVEGKRYLDLTAAFGVAATGHAHPSVIAAMRDQSERLLHAMGDVHPHRGKADLAELLSQLVFERFKGWMPGRRSVRGKVIFCNSGFEAVEAALKTAYLASGRPGVIAFEGGYHGLGYGALNTTEREHFRGPFRGQLREFGHFVPYPDGGDAGVHRQMSAIEAAMEQLVKDGSVGAVLVEPVQARGGIRVPPIAFLRRVREICDRLGLVMIVDEIYTGFGRTGDWFGFEASRVVPDLVCLGKALTGGFPLSACVGRADLMDQAWPKSTGEAIHTSTFLGHPVGCAMAIAQIHELDRGPWIEQSASLGDHLLGRLNLLASEEWPWQLLPRGRGLMVGMEFLHANGAPAGSIVFEVVKQMLQRGFILLPEGAEGEVLGFTPPLTIRESQLNRTVKVLREVLREVSDRTKVKIKK